MEIEEKEKNIQILSLDTLLEILGNPTRRAILNKLAKFPHSAPELANALGISRQAVHSQLTLLQEKDIIEPLEASEIRGDKYRIKTDISVNIDITPDYYNIKYNTSSTDPESELIDFKDMNCSVDYSKIKSPNDKIRFLSEEIRKIEKTMTDLELKRKEILNQKECLILEIKNLMHG
ncbi:MAG: ArsR/SmtB family transcription factor, partial [Promethearchaeota archaeon]